MGYTAWGYVLDCLVRARQLRRYGDRAGARRVLRAARLEWPKASELSYHKAHAKVGAVNCRRGAACVESHMHDDSEEVTRG